MKLTEEQLRQLIREGIFDSFFRQGKTNQASLEAEKKERARETLRRLKSGELTMQDLVRDRKESPDAELNRMSQETDDLIARLQNQETREEKLARLRAKLQKRKQGIR